MAWQPQEESLRQLACCLKDSLSGHDQTAQKRATEVSWDLPAPGICLGGSRDMAWPFLRSRISMLVQPRLILCVVLDTSPGQVIP